MAGPDPEAEERRLRRKKTLWLLAGGALSLLLPLLGAVYLHWSQSGGVHAATDQEDVFEHRDGARVTPSQEVVVQPEYRLPAGAPTSKPGAAKPAQSSLDFIRPAAELKSAPTAAPKAVAAKAPVEVKAEAVPDAKAKPAPKKQGAQPFAMPKLQPTRGFTSMQGFGTSAKPAAQKPTQTQSRDMQEFLKQLPPGSQNDPRVQEYLKEHGGGQ
jgi:hypothetical protein